jgi:hypothetical protein
MAQLEKKHCKHTPNESPEIRASLLQRYITMSNFNKT